MTTIETHVSGAAGGFSDVYTLTLPGDSIVAGDAVVVRATQTREASTMVLAGLGGTWTRVAGAATGFQQVWICRDPAPGGGNITVTTPGLATWMHGAVTVLRDLTSTTVASVEGTLNGSGPNPVTPIAAGPGQVALAAAQSGHISAPYPSLESVPADWTRDALVATALTNCGESWHGALPDGDVVVVGTNSNSSTGAQLVVVFGDIEAPSGFGFLGDQEVTALHLGGQSVTALYLGDQATV